MEKEKVRWGTVIKLAGAVVAFLIGSGFATGQEISQYFTAYGWKGVLVSLVVLIIFLFVGNEWMLTGHREKFEKPSRIFQYYGGKWIGGFYDIFTIIFVFMSYIVMIGGAGATLNQHYGLPTWVGGITIAVLATATVLMGLKGIVGIIGRIGPIIIILAIGLAIVTIVRDGGNIKEGSDMVLSGQVEMIKVGNNWFQSASSYAGFCLLWLAAFLSGLGGQAGSKREAILGASIGSIGFVLACVLVCFALLTDVNGIAEAAIPNLILAVKLNPVFASAFSVIIILGIYTTAVPLLWQPCARFTVEKSKNFKILTVILGALGCIVGLTLPFQQLVNIIYGINGYVGILILLFVIIKMVRRKMDKGKIGSA